MIVRCIMLHLAQELVFYPYVTRELPDQLLTENEGAKDRQAPREKDRRALREERKVSLSLLLPVLSGLCRCHAEWQPTVIRRHY